MALTIERIPIVDREQWLRERQRDVTASVIGALFGVHPYASALRVFAEKHGISVPDEGDNAVLRRGRWLEPAVALAVGEERPDWQIVPAREYLRAPAQHLGCTPDFYVRGDPRGLGVLQAKTVGPAAFEEWAEGPPEWIMLQTLTEAMLADAAFGVAAALKVHAYDMAVTLHEIPRQPELEARILAAVAAFWADFDAGRAPEADLRKDAELAKALAPVERKGKVINLAGNNAMYGLLEEREQLMAKISEAEGRKGEIETHVRFLLGDAEEATGILDWSITWRSHRRKECVVPAKDIRTLRIARRRDRDDF